MFFIWGIPYLFMHSSFQNTRHTWSLRGFSKSCFFLSLFKSLRYYCACVYSTCELIPRRSCWPLTQGNQIIKAVSWLTDDCCGDIIKVWPTGDTHCTIYFILFCGVTWWSVNRLKRWFESRWNIQVSSVDTTVIINTIWSQISTPNQIIWSMPLWL